VTLFNVPYNAPATERRAAAKPPRWTLLPSSTRTRCEHCTRDNARKGGGIAHTARQRRHHEGHTLSLCYSHARPIRDADDAAVKRAA
jgi:hypothetical protein